jgi:hypothetical protein
MSTLGQNRTLGHVRVMSALPPKADIAERDRNVRFVPKADILHCRKNAVIRDLLDYLVGAGEQRVRHIEAERLGCLKIDDQLILGRGLHRKVRGLLPLENAVHVASRSPGLLQNIIAIRDQAAAGDEATPVIDRRQFVLGRKRDDQFAMGHCQRARRQDEAAIWGAGKRRDGAFDIAGGIAQVDRCHLHPERRRHGLYDRELADSTG